jgi:hypothetical protein
VSLRPPASAVLANEDLFEEALTRLDAWGDASGMPDRMLTAGVAWWFRARETEWNWLHERILWRRALGRLMADHGIEITGVEIPPGEPALADVVRALGGRAPAAAHPVEPASGASTGPARRGLIQRIGGRIGRATGQPPAATSMTTAPSTPDALPSVDERKAALDDRLQWLSGAADRPVIVLSHMGIRQAIGGPDGGRHLDPNLGGVIRRLESAGRPPVVIGLGLDHRKDADWPTIEPERRLLPFSILSTLRGRDEPDDVPVEAAVAALLAAIDDAPVVPLDVDGADVAPALREQLRTFASTVVPVALRQVPRIGRLLDELAPSAVLLTHEGIRTPWLVAAARRDVPTFAVQHGVIYATHPGYAHPRRTGLVLPARTFVFGDFERQVLLDHGGYREQEVEVAGSPRLDLDAAVGAATTDPAARDLERTAVRRELGVADGDRMVVISTVNLPFVRRFHVVQMLERMLDGPLENVHVVLKQHPGELDEGPYLPLLAGLAAARGGAPPPVTVTREIDLYRLLRAADAHLGLRSTVLTDAVVAGAPNLIALVQAHADLLGYVEAGVARPVRGVADLVAALDDPRPMDPDARAVFLARHFRAGDASERIAAAVLAARPGVAATIGRDDG